MSALGLEITCQRCLRHFEFPAAEPNASKHAKWAYRVIGPFALPDYAAGGYAASLAVRFFASEGSSLGSPSISWAGGQGLTFADGRKAEADFIIWHQRRDHFRHDHATEVIFGEAKSFGKPGKDCFLDEDIDRLKLLAERFPGSVLVFATMKEADELTAKEVRRIRKLAEWGREYEREHRRTRAPVILLTATELFAPYLWSMAWKDKGGRHAQLIEHADSLGSRNSLVP